MKYGHTVKKDGILYPAGTEVPAGESMKVELTDDVHDGALDVNADGSVSTYDEHGNAIDAVSSEEVEQLQEQAGEIFEEQKKTKGGRKSKEA